MLDDREIAMSIQLRTARDVDIHLMNNSQQIDKANSEKNKTYIESKQAEKMNMKT